MNNSELYEIRVIIKRSYICLIYSNFYILYMYCRCTYVEPSVEGSMRFGVEFNLRTVKSVFIGFA